MQSRHQSTHFIQFPSLHRGVSSLPSMHQPNSLPSQKHPLHEQVAATPLTCVAREAAPRDGPRAGDTDRPLLTGAVPLLLLPALLALLVKAAPDTLAFRLSTSSACFSNSAGGMIRTVTRLRGERLLSWLDMVS